MTNRRSAVIGLFLAAVVLAAPSGATAQEAQSPPVTKHYVTVGGGQLHYVTAGKGDTVLLLHQAPLSHAEFLETIPILARHFRVVAWDAPGHGSSFIPDHAALRRRRLLRQCRTAGLYLHALSKLRGSPPDRKRRRLHRSRAARGLRRGHHRVLHSPGTGSVRDCGGGWPAPSATVTSRKRSWATLRSNGASLLKVRR